MPSSFGLIAFFSIIIDGSDSVITPIINARTTPSFAPFATSASAMGIQPKMSAYIGIPQIVAMITPNGLPVPRTLTTHSSGKKGQSVLVIPHYVNKTVFITIKETEVATCTVFYL